MYGLDEERCITTTPAPNITMTARFFQRQATLTAARSNFSITNVDAMTEPVPVTDIDLPAYRAALGWLLDFRAANVPATSSVAEMFWTDSDALRDPSYHAVLTQSFQGILVFPFWLFNANNYGNLALQAETVISTLPPEFYTEASIVAPYSVLKLNKSMFYLFIALQGAVLLFFTAVLLYVWILGGGLPMISAFPLFDSMFKAKLASDNDLGDVTKADDAQIVKATQDLRVVLRKE